MNCRPGDIARIVGLRHPALAELKDRIVLLKNEPPIFLDGSPAWRLERPVDFVLHANGWRDGRWFWVGESVSCNVLQDMYLRPIRDPGDGAVDESRAWLPPVPNAHEVPA